MSSKKVTDFLAKEEIAKISKKEAQLRYEILSHFNLGEKVEYKAGDDIEDFLLEDTSGRKFRYDCDISEEDYNKVKSIYDREKTSKKGSESVGKALRVIAIVLLVLGCLAFVYYQIITSILLNEPNELLVLKMGIPYILGGISMVILLSSLSSWGIIKAFRNVSK